MRHHAPLHMDAHKRSDYQNSYDRVADEYVRRIFDELQHKPLDRQFLDRFAASVRDVGPTCDMGCGTGHEPTCFTFSPDDQSRVYAANQRYTF